MTTPNPLHRYLHAQNLTTPLPWPFEKLSPRQKDVAFLMLSGLRYKQIAAELQLSTKTIDVHRRLLLAKLGIASPVELAYLAIAVGLIQVPVVTHTVPAATESAPALEAAAPFAPAAPVSDDEEVAQEDEVELTFDDMSWIDEGSGWPQAISEALFDDLG